MQPLPEIYDSQIESLRAKAEKAEKSQDFDALKSVCERLFQHACKSDQDNWHLKCQLSKVRTHLHVAA